MLPPCVTNRFSNDCSVVILLLFSGECLCCSVKYCFQAYGQIAPLLTFVPAAHIRNRITKEDVVLLLWEANVIVVLELAVVLVAQFL
jgi:hypothetical protein